MARRVLLRVGWGTGEARGAHITRPLKSNLK